MTTTTTTLAAPTCAANFAGCSVYTDLTGAGPTVTITFTSFQYTPKCARVRTTQAVQFSGDFGFHPLRSAPCSSGIGPGPGPYTLTAPGIYGFHCFNHGLPNGQDMAGALEVVP